MLCGRDARGAKQWAQHGHGRVNLAKQAASPPAHRGLGSTTWQQTKLQQKLGKCPVHDTPPQSQGQLVIKNKLSVEIRRLLSATGEHGHYQ